MLEFYKKLYISVLDSTSEEVGRFLEQVNLVSLKQDDREALRRLVTKELFETIQSLQNGKALGRL